jgi:uncharacterized delta-60 repeat protein
MVVASLTAALVAGAAIPASAGPPGSLDHAFGDGGRVDRDFGDDRSEAGVAFARQPDGKLLVAGKQIDGGSARFAVARYLPGGGFDQGFGDHGHEVIDVGPDSLSTEASGVAITPGGKIVLGGNAGDGDVAVVRLLANGDPDTSFNQTGVRTFGFGPGSFDEAFAVAVQGDGKIVLVGSAARNGVQRFAVARVRKNGALDPGFSGDGRTTTAFGASAEQRAEGVAILDDGRIVAFGESDQGGVRGSDFAIAVYRSNGTRSPQFSGDGRALTDFGGDEYGYKAAEDATGKIVVSGETDPTSSECDWALARYKPGGVLDHGFGGDGKVVTQFGNGCDIASGLLLQGDGKVVGVGSEGHGSTFDAAVARYLPNGHLDLTFSGDGQVVTPFGDGSSEFWDAAETPAGKIVAGGRVLHPGGELGNFALARYFR